MTGQAFYHHRQAALALLADFPDKLTRHAAGFLGHCCITPELTGAQRDWLDKLLTSSGLPPLAA